MSLPIACARSAVSSFARAGRLPSRAATVAKRGSSATSGRPEARQKPWNSASVEHGDGGPAVGEAEQAVAAADRRLVRDAVAEQDVVGACVGPEERDRRRRASTARGAGRRAPRARANSAAVIACAAVERGDLVADDAGGRAAARRSRSRLHRRDARVGLDHVVVDALSGVRPALAEAADRDVDQLGLRGAQRGLADAHARRPRRGGSSARRRRRRRDQLAQQRAPAGRAEVERERALAAVRDRGTGRHAAARGRSRAARRPARRLDLDHVGALVGEDRRGERARDHRGAVHDADAGEGQFHRFLRCGRREHTRGLAADERPGLRPAPVHRSFAHPVSRGGRGGAPARGRRLPRARRGRAVGRSRRATRATSCAAAARCSPSSWASARRPTRASTGSARTRTRRTCASSRRPTSRARAFSSSRWSRTAACCSTPGSTATCRSPGA